MYYPIVLKVARKPILVIGGGEVAEGKVQSLLEADANVTVVSPDLTAKLHELAQSGAIAWSQRTYRTSDIDQAFLIISATDDPHVQETVWQDARERKVLVNTVDEPERCDFIMPSLIRQNDVLVAVSTSGKSPAFAAWLRRKIAGFITPEVGRVASLLGKLRDEVRQRFTTITDRKRAYERIIDSGIVNWIRDYDDATAEAKVRKMIQEL